MRSGTERTGTKFSSKQPQCYQPPFSSRSPPFPIRMTKKRRKTWLEQNTSALDISWEEIPRSFWYRSLPETPNKKLKRRLKETNLEAKMQVSVGWMLWLPWLFSDPWILGKPTDSWSLSFAWWYFLSLLWLVTTILNGPLLNLMGFTSVQFCFV